VGGLDYRADPTTLTPGGELVALLDGRATFELHGELLMRRGVDHIRAERSAPVLAEHRCGPIPDEYVDHVWFEVAVLLVVRLLGGTPVLPDQPPF
jgi:hypothetical protein